METYPTLGFHANLGTESIHRVLSKSDVVQV